MNSFYKRQFVMMAGVIMISFALLGTAFITLSYQYTIREKRESMSRNADYIAAFTANMRDMISLIGNPSSQEAQKKE